MQKNPYTRTVAIGTFSCAATLTLLLDLVSKRWFFDQFLLDAAPRFSLLGGRVQHFLHANLGATFNTPLPLPLIVIGAVFFCAWLILFLFSNHSHWKHPVLVVSAGLVFGGALGNLYDRIFLGFVRDWILLWHRAIANIADFAVVIGCASLLLFAIIIPARQQRRSVQRSKA